MVLLLALVAVPPVVVAGPEASAACPRAEPLAPSGGWRVHRLAPGVQLQEGVATDRNGRGRVKMHVLRINLGRHGVSIRPLLRSVAERTRLTRLARPHRQLVAAVNTGYYDFATGAPTQPLIVASRPLVAEVRRQRVVGVDANKAPMGGLISLVGDVTLGAETHRLAGINAVRRRHGLVVYNSSWGSAPIPLSAGSSARPVVRSRLGALVRSRAMTTAPKNGYMLVANGKAAKWLSRQAVGALAGVRRRIETTASRNFTQAYGVGTQIVADGHGKAGLACNSAGTAQPARTAIGIAKSKTLIIGEVEDHPGTQIHGLDEDQMGSFMQQLGAERAWDLDGSGSTELLARMPHDTGLSLRTYPADGKERPMPVGLGIVYNAPRDRTHR